MTDSLQGFKDELSRAATGMTTAEAHAKGVCIHCKLPATADRFSTDAGRREYQISGMCGICFDQLFAEEEE